MNNKNKDRYSEGESEGEWDKVVITLVTISLSSIFFSFLILFITDNAQFVAKFKDTGTVGDTIGGLMNPFIALAGVLITFLAFYMQIKANRIQIKLFNKNQIEQNNLIKEQLFFRLIDNLNQRILNFSFIDNKTQEEFTSYKSIDKLIDKFYETIDSKCYHLGKLILCYYPEKIDDLYYRNILKYKFNNPSKEDIESLKNKILSIEDNSDRLEYLKLLYGDIHTQSIVDRGFKTIAKVYFYKIDFINRKHIYEDAYNEVLEEHISFLDGFTKNFCYIINFIEKNDKNDFFKDYLKGNLSSQELILIFYFCASNKSTSHFRLSIKNIVLLDGLLAVNHKFIDSPSEEELLREIKLVLNS